MPRSVVAIALLALIAHLLTLSNYGFYRDELYFLACFHHLSWGFVDQPPLIPLISGIALLFGDRVFGARVLVAVAAAFTVLVASILARDFGAGRFGQVVAAAATALMPGSLFLGNTLTTTSFEPLTWTLTLWLAVRLARTPTLRTWSGLTLVIAVAAYMKYSIFLLVVVLAVAAGLRGTIRLGGLIAGAGIAAAVLLAPNVAWQASHGFPILEVLRGDTLARHGINSGLQLEYSSPLRNAAAFFVEQILYAGPLATPLWVAGIVALLRRAQLRFAAFAGLAYLIFVLVALVTLAKGYYVIGIYPSLFAAGAASLERVAVAARNAYTGTLIVASLVLAPVFMPLLPVDALIGYMHAFGAPQVLVQPAFADEFGWEGLTRTVARYYRALPNATRAQTPVFADTYGDAAAIDYYGGRYGLPPAISAQDQYYLWGTRGYSLSRMLAVGASEYAILKTLYANVRMLGTFSDPYRRVLEGPTPIYLCTGPRVPLARIWPALRWYGEYGHEP
jgi:hypothetical protein